ncbi:unnamed protein product [Lathyrus oleraceus]|uniref:M-phase phosphoprotein 6 n=1 Tax=Pisum sativum TaxID=3888 RepID=A0A9D4X2A0_PEA|nr:uncharacterized protein LOC127087189 [Pisum sativum]KAI5413458.1 hypothetical protein KIW84_057872 [Pisum sativum]
MSKLSSTLTNLKFMQRAAAREEKIEKVEDEVKPDVSFGSTSTISRRCVVLVEGDPRPGAFKGRMSFQSFNPTIDKLNEEEVGVNQPVAKTSISKNKNANVSVRENNSSEEGTEHDNMSEENHEVNGNVKRKQSEVINEPHYPNKSPKNDQGNKQSSSSNRLGSFKKPSVDKLDWNVLRSSGVKQNR